MLDGREARFVAQPQRGGTCDLAQHHRLVSGAQPHLDDIWGDSSIRNTPHVILWLSREFFTHNMDVAFERNANVYVLKSRNDRTGIVPLEFDPERVRFLDAPPTEKDSVHENRRTAHGN